MPRVESLSAWADDAPRTSGLALLTLVERSADQVEMRDVITRMSPGDEADQVRVWLDKVAFDRWLEWVDALSDDGIDVAETNIGRSGDNLVGLRVTLQR